MKSLLLLLILAAPVHAVTFAGGPSHLRVDTVRAEATVRRDGETMRVSYSCTLRLGNPGEGGEFRLILPAKLEAELIVAGNRLPGEARQGGRTEWRVHVAALGEVDLLCTCSLTPRRLPHLHVLGLWRVELPLQLVRGFAAYPQNAAVAVHWRGMPAECFGAGEDSEGLRYSLAIDRHPQAHEIEWRGASAAEGLAEVHKRVEAIAEPQRVHDNRAYTEALVAQVEIAEFAGDHALLADTCTTLAALEASARRAITHCGPWAKWRKHVPWQLRRVEALEAMRAEAKAAAVDAVAALYPLMESYERAKSKARPIEEFDPDRFGNYWDYDWERVQKLFLRAQELAGD